VDTLDTDGYITLTVQLVVDDSACSLRVDGLGDPQVIPLKPTTVAIRLWRNGDKGILRGTIRLHGTDFWAPLHSNTLLEQLVRAWLCGKTE
jgi:hypothetical protein